MNWDDIVSPADMAAELSVSRSVVSNWIARYASFPQPLTTVSQGRTKLFSMWEVRQWHDRQFGE